MGLFGKKKENDTKLRYEDIVFDTLDSLIAEVGVNRFAIWYAYTHVSTGDLIYLSYGVRLANEREAAREAVLKFLDGDYGSYYKDGETPVEGHEFGIYPSRFGDTRATGAFVVHREPVNGSLRINNRIVAYFGFERNDSDDGGGHPEKAENKKVQLMGEVT